MSSSHNLTWLLNVEIVHELVHAIVLLEVLDQEESVVHDIVDFCVTILLIRVGAAVPPALSTHWFLIIIIARFSDCAPSFGLSLWSVQSRLKERMGEV